VVRRVVAPPFATVSPPNPLTVTPPFAVTIPLNVPIDEVSAPVVVVRRVVAPPFATVSPPTPLTVKPPFAVSIPLNVPVVELNVVVVVPSKDVGPKETVKPFDPVIKPEEVNVLSTARALSRDAVELVRVR